MEKQSIQSQQAEIRFRKKLFQQQIEGQKIFDDEYDSQGIEKILRERIKDTYTHINNLQESGIKLSPYVEIGAERCQRSLIIENDMKLSGAAIDISFDMLKSANYYKDVFKMRNLPLRICCDANSLPFMTDSIPFIFCYETLHHFPDPTPIIREVYRVLAPGGCFFFKEEPYKKVLHINLYKGKSVYSKENINRSILRKMFDYFFADVTCNEESYGIIENDEISISTWKQALNVFEKKRIKLTSLKMVGSNLYRPKNYLKYWINYLLGGEISGTCYKIGNYNNSDISIYDVLRCPFCYGNGKESKLRWNGKSFICDDCSKKIPIIDGVSFLFSYEKLKEIYPDVFDSYFQGTKAVS